MEKINSISKDLNKKYEINEIKADEYRNCWFRYWQLSQFLCHFRPTVVPQTFLKACLEPLRSKVVQFVRLITKSQSTGLNRMKIDQHS